MHINGYKYQITLYRNLVALKYLYVLQYCFIISDLVNILNLVEIFEYLMYGTDM